MSPSALGLGHRSFPSLIFDESGNGEFLSDARKEINYKRSRACVRLRVKNRGCILGADPSRRREKDEGWMRWGVGVGGEKEEEEEEMWNNRFLVQGKTV